LCGPTSHLSSGNHTITDRENIQQQKFFATQKISCLLFRRVLLLHGSSPWAKKLFLKNALPPRKLSASYSVPVAFHFYNVSSDPSQPSADPSQPS
jgi:hypothetical protein